MVHDNAGDRPDAVPATGDRRHEQPFIERRAVGRALSNWDRLRETREFPSRAACLASFDKDLTDGVIVVEITPREENDLIVECGPLFRKAYGKDPAGLTVKTVMPSSTNRGLIFWRVAAEMRKPIADVGEFTNLHGEEIIYRSVFLPISEDGKRITHLMAAFSYKAIH